MNRLDLKLDPEKRVFDPQVSYNQTSQNVLLRGVR